MALRYRDLEGNLTYVNESFAEMHGYSAEELIGKPLSIFHNEEQMTNVKRANDATCRERQLCWRRGMA